MSGPSLQGFASLERYCWWVTGHYSV